MCPWLVGLRLTFSSTEVSLSCFLAVCLPPFRQMGRAGVGVFNRDATGLWPYATVDARDHPPGI